MDLVYAELAKAQARAGLVEADGLARGRTDRTGDVRDEELTGLFERDALVFNAARRRSTLDTQYEGLVFGRLDLDHALADEAGPRPRDPLHRSPRRPRRRLRAARHRLARPAAAAFYRATPVEPMDVLRRRVLRCKGPDVVGVEDDLMVAEPPDDLVVVGDGALLAALTRSRGAQMRDIVATIQRHQDEAIRASARGVTEITGGPGTGKTVVALHRAAYLLYSDRRRFETGGILVVGPSAAYTAYIERRAALARRGVGDPAVRSVTSSTASPPTRLDPPAVAAIKGSLRDPAAARPRGLRTRRRGRRSCSARSSTARPSASTPRPSTGSAPGAARPPAQPRRPRPCATHSPRPRGPACARATAPSSWTASRTTSRSTRSSSSGGPRSTRARCCSGSPTPTAGPAATAQGVLTPQECDVFAASMREALDVGTWSVADAALVDDLAARLGPVQDGPAEERGFYEIEELDDVSQFGVAEVRAGAGCRAPARRRSPRTAPTDPRERLLQGQRRAARASTPTSSSTRPRTCRPCSGACSVAAAATRRGPSSATPRRRPGPTPMEAGRAREEAFGTQERRLFHMDTNYRNAREIFDYARRGRPRARCPTPTSRRPCARPVSSRSTRSVTAAGASAVTDAVERPARRGRGVRSRWSPRPVRTRSWRRWPSAGDGRVAVIDPMSTKGLEYDATVIVDPDEITDESPGGVRVLYVVLTRAAHRMTVLRPA